MLTVGLQGSALGQVWGSIASVQPQISTSPRCVSTKFCQANYDDPPTFPLIATTTWGHHGHPPYFTVELSPLKSTEIALKPKPTTAVVFVFKGIRYRFLWATFQTCRCSVVNIGFWWTISLHLDHCLFGYGSGWGTSLASRASRLITFPLHSPLRPAHHYFSAHILTEILIN